VLHDNGTIAATYDGARLTSERARYIVCYSTGYMPPTISVQMEDTGVWIVKGLPYQVRMHVGPRSDGRLVCTMLQLKAPSEEEISARGLREIPLGALLDTLTMWLAPKAGEPTLKAPKGPGLPVKHIGWYGDELWHEVPVPPPPPAITPELLREVAVRYRQLVRTGSRSPIKALAEQHKWSNGRIYAADNIRRLLRLARDQRLLGPAIHGKAGERRARSKSKVKKTGRGSAR